MSARDCRAGFISSCVMGKGGYVVVCLSGLNY